jgi:ribosome biogenesis GTPase / thiamine phosphate phosphatase
MNEARADEREARVVESFGRRVAVEIETGERLTAELFGKRITCVCGDYVRIRTATDVGDVPRVIEVLPRRTLFSRTDSRGRTEPLAANLTLLAVIVAPEPEPDPYITDRYLAGAAFAGVASLVIINKADLATTQSEKFTTIIDDYRRAGFRVVALSAQNVQTVEPLRALFSGEVAMFVGQSGVGKSTLTNQLAPASARATRSLSGSTGEGRHTTVSTALVRLPSGGELIDSPGVRDYAPPPLEDASVQVGWPEILQRAASCRFNNCLHLREPGCAVINAVAANEISARRYESYKRLVNIMRGLAPEYERRR